jgi:hypothetical protein
MLARNAPVSADWRIVFRIGVNIGDVIIDGPLRANDHETSESEEFSLGA